MSYEDVMNLIQVICVLKVYRIYDFNEKLNTLISQTYIHYETKYRNTYNLRGSDIQSLDICSKTAASYEVKTVVGG